MTRVKTIVSRSRFDEDQCIACGCTDRRACEGGCEWTLLAPPVCSACMYDWIIAQLWGAIFQLESAAKPPIARKIDRLRQSYSQLGPRGGLPTLRKICQIHRNEARWQKAHRASKGAQRT